ncbi:TPA: hypothetical protein DDW35_01525, partial [Candidatus Sumerlaeota bacterium]|nr:hypothetical protein [Candidatus Sumerlaeota bacterium]
MKFNNRFKNLSNIALIFLSSLLLTLSLFFANADTVKLKDGRVLTCTILQENPNEVVVQSPGGKMTLPRTNVESLSKGEKTAQVVTAAPVQSFDAEAMLAAKRYPEAWLAVKQLGAP